LRQQVDTIVILARLEAVCDIVLTTPGSSPQHRLLRFHHPHHHAAAARLGDDNRLPAIDEQALGDDVDELAVEIGFAGRSLSQQLHARFFRGLAQRLVKRRERQFSSLGEV